MVEMFSCLPVSLLACLFACLPFLAFFIFLCLLACLFALAVYLLAC